MDRPLKYCTESGCSALVPFGRCEAHAIRRQETARDNVAVRRWYRTDRWARLRIRVLVDAAYTCAKCGVIRIDLEVDHYIPHRGDPALFWNWANLQPLCHDCHTNKTNRGE